MLFVMCLSGDNGPHDLHILIVILKVYILNMPDQFSRLISLKMQIFTLMLEREEYIIGYLETIWKRRIQMLDIKQE